MRSGSRPQCSRAKKRPVRPSPVWTSSQHSSVPVAAARGLGRREVAVGRQVDALALNRLDDERRDVAGRELLLQGLEVAERDALAARQQRPEAVAELIVAVERQCAERQAVEAMLGEQDPRAAGRRACQLDRRFDRLGAAVGEHHSVDARRRELDQPLRQQPGQQRDAHLRQVGCRGVEYVGERRDDPRVRAPDREYAVAAQQVQIARAGVVDQVRALAAHPRAVEAERPHDAPELRVQVGVVERHRSAGTLPQNAREVGRTAVRHVTNPTARLVGAAVGRVVAPASRPACRSSRGRSRRRRARWPPRRSRRRRGRSG